MHTPVLLKEAIDALSVRKGGKYIDATYGEGGYSREIVRRGGKVLALDWDEENVARKQLAIQQFSNSAIRLVWSNYANIKEIAQKYNFCPCDAVIFDLGLSMGQISSGRRGFSYKALGEALDMRISGELAKTAADIINSSKKQELYEIFAKNSEEIDSGTIAESLYRASRMRRFVKVDDLVKVVDKALPALRGEREGVLRRIFQALRIEVNNEFENLKRGLKGAVEIVRRDGRVIVVTFHPSEDRIVKKFVRKRGLNFFTKKPILAKSGARFERSAKLRIIVRT